MANGFVMLSKELMDSEDYFSERFTRMQAYLDLCLLAEWKDRKFIKRGQVVELKAGQLAKSEEELAERWQWSRNTVRKYLNEQQNIGNLAQQKSRLITIITVKFGLNVAQQIEQQTPPKTEQQFEQPTKDIHKDKEYNNKEKDSKESKKKEPETEHEKQFEAFRLKYKEFGGKARGFETEFENFKKKHQDWKEVTPILGFALEKENAERVQAIASGGFFPQMKNLQTYLNQRSWEAYYDESEKHDPNEYHPLTDGMFQVWMEKENYLRFDGQINSLNDGYTADTRPDGATVGWQMYRWVWSKDQKRWNKK